jgi:hypothetical protein
MGTYIQDLFVQSIFTKESNIYAGNEDFSSSEKSLIQGLQNMMIIKKQLLLMMNKICFQKLARKIR